MDPSPPVAYAYAASTGLLPPPQSPASTARGVHQDEPAAGRRTAQQTAETVQRLYYIKPPAAPPTGLPPIRISSDRLEAMSERLSKAPARSNGTPRPRGNGPHDPTVYLGGLEECRMPEYDARHDRNLALYWSRKQLAIEQPRLAFPSLFDASAPSPRRRPSQGRRRGKASRGEETEAKGTAGLADTSQKEDDGDDEAGSEEQYTQGGKARQPREQLTAQRKKPVAARAAFLARAAYARPAVPGSPKRAPHAPPRRKSKPLPKPAPRHVATSPSPRKRSASSSRKPPVPKPATARTGSTTTDKGERPRQQPVGKHQSANPPAKDGHEGATKTESNPNQNQSLGRDEPAQDATRAQRSPVADDDSTANGSDTGYSEDRYSSSSGVQTPSTPADTGAEDRAEAKKETSPSAASARTRRSSGASVDSARRSGGPPNDRSPRAASSTSSRSTHSADKDEERRPSTVGTGTSSVLLDEETRRRRKEQKRRAKQRAMRVEIIERYFGRRFEDEAIELAASDAPASRIVHFHDEQGGASVRAVLDPTTLQRHSTDDGGDSSSRSFCRWRLVVDPVGLVQLMVDGVAEETMVLAVGSDRTQVEVRPTRASAPASPLDAACGPLASDKDTSTAAEWWEVVALENEHFVLESVQQTGHVVEVQLDTSAPQLLLVPDEESSSFCELAVASHHQPAFL